MADQHRENPKYDAIYLDANVEWGFRVYTIRDRKKVPYDLTSVTDVRLQIYDADSDASLRKDLALTVRTGDEYLEKGVANYASGVLLLDDTTTGEVRCKLIMTISAAPYLVGKPWKATVYDGGPTS